MIRKTVVFEENIHHTCLTFGLKRSFEKMPFLNRKTLNIKGSNRLIDNIVSLPPMMRKIDKSLDKRKNRNIVEVSYFKNKLSVEFNEELEYKIVGSTEANSLKGFISNESPLGIALIGKKKDDMVEVESPSGMIQYKILKLKAENGIPSIQLLHRCKFKESRLDGGCARFDVL